MDFEYSEIVTYPQAVVYPTLRDDMSELLPYLPNVDEVEVIERHPPEDGTQRIVNKWFGNNESAPAAVRKLVSRDMITWIDHALWKDAESHVEWRMETVKFDGLFDCSGVNHFDDVGDGQTRIRITGSIQIYPDRIPGVPRFLARKLQGPIERYMIDSITPNLAAMPSAIQRYLDSKNAG